MTNRPRFDISTLSGAAQDDVATRKAPTLRALDAPMATVARPPKEPKGAGRPGARGVTVWLNPDDWMELKTLGLKTKRTTQDLVEGWIKAGLAQAADRT